MRRARLALLATLAAAACGKAAPPPDQSAAAPPRVPDEEAPVALNGNSPIQYPPRLFDQNVEGDVVLRLYVDSTGRLAPESSRVAESSGYPELDSAALAGAKRLRFAPPRRHGTPVRAAFLQTIQFRHPPGSALQGAPDPSPHLQAGPDTSPHVQVSRDTFRRVPVSRDTSRRLRGNPDTSSHLQGSTDTSAHPQGSPDASPR